MFAYLVLKGYFFRAKQPLIIVAWRATSLKPVSIKSSSLNRGHHLSLQVPYVHINNYSHSADVMREGFAFSLDLNKM